MTGGRGEWPAAPTAGDVALVLVALATAAVLAVAGGPAAAADRVVVEVDGTRRLEATLDRPQTLRVDGVLGPSVIRVEAGRARVVSAPCPGQVCVARGWLHASGDVSACVPNRVVVRLDGGAPPLDGVSR